MNNLIVRVGRSRYQLTLTEESDWKRAEAAAAKVSNMSDDQLKECARRLAMYIIRPSIFSKLRAMVELAIIQREVARRYPESLVEPLPIGKRSPEYP